MTITSNKNAGDLIVNRIAFHGNSLSGLVTSPDAFDIPISTSMGMLPHTHISLLFADRPSYIIYSYSTPIAWYTSNGQWVIPSLKYSVTTSKHQSLVRGATQSWVSLS
jgi:hypothetical protein